MEQYRVIKKINNGRRMVAKVGDVLIAKQNFSRLWGVTELLKGSEYICDLGSPIANECCVRISE